MDVVALDLDGEDRIDSLTDLHRQTIGVIATDASVPGKWIAERLNISEHTLLNHLTSIDSKLALSNRMDLYLFAQKHGLSEKSTAP